jgi:hypothetical protein
VNDSNDDNALGICDKEHHVRKSTQQGAPNTGAHLSVRSGDTCDRREGRIASPEELGAQPRLSLLIPSKCRVHFERGGGENREGERWKIHSRTVKLVLKDSLPDLLPAEGAFATLVEVFKPPVELGAERGSQW